MVPVLVPVLVLVLVPVQAKGWRWHVALLCAVCSLDSSVVRCLLCAVQTLSTPLPDNPRSSLLCSALPPGPRWLGRLLWMAD